MALACQGCNNHKYNKTEAIDPITGDIAPLYHPRQQKWSDHFSWNEDFSLIIGITMIGRVTVETLQLNRAVSPPGGDFSEPVTSHTKEIVQTFWALSKELADARHYPSIDWNDSFSDYVNTAQQWWAHKKHKKHKKNKNAHWLEYRNEALKLLAQADELARIVNLVGPEALSPALGY